MKKRLESETKIKSQIKKNSKYTSYLETLEEAIKLMELEFEYVTDYLEKKILSKRE